MTTLALKCAEFQADITAGLLSILQTEEYANVTIAVDGKHLKANQMVLSVCSPYFKSLLQSTPSKHPIIFIKNVKYNIMEHLLRFMYKGETEIEGEDFDLFIETARELQIMWLMNSNEENIKTTKSALNGSGSESTSEQLTTQSTVLLNDEEPIEPAAPNIAERVAKRRKMSIEERNTECDATTIGSNDIPPDIKQEQAFDVCEEEYELTIDKITNINYNFSEITELSTNAGRFFAEPIDKTFDPNVVVLDDLPEIKQEKMDDGDVVVDVDNGKDDDVEVLQPFEPVAHTTLEGTTIRSQKGGTLILLEGYIFSKNKVLSDMRQSWRCCYKNCNVYLHGSTDGAKINLVMNAHNHEKPNVRKRRLSASRKEAAKKRLRERKSYKRMAKKEQTTP